MVIRLVATNELHGVNRTCAQKEGNGGVRKRRETIP